MEKKLIIKIKQFRYKVFLYYERCTNNIIYAINYIFFFTKKTKRQKRILITRLDSIGDFVLFTASIPNYRKLYKDYEIVLLVKDFIYVLARNCPYVDKVWKISQDKFRKNIFYKFKWAVKLRKYHFEKAIQPIYSNGFDIFNILIAFTFAKERIAYKTGDRKKGIYFNKLYEYSFDVTTFEISRNNKLVQLLGYKGELNNKTYIWFDDYTKYKKWKKLNKDEFAVLFPGSQIDYKIYSKEKYLKIINEMNKFKWVITGSEKEKYFGEYFIKNSKSRILDLTGKTNLLELAYIIKNAKFLLSNDTAAVHIAAATETKTFCVMGGGHYVRFYPYPNNKNTIAIIHKMDCFNCDWQCIYESKVCIDKIDENDILKVIRRNL